MFLPYNFSLSLLQALAVAQPFAYDDYLERKKQEKLEADRAQRITVCFSNLSSIRRLLFVCWLLTSTYVCLVLAAEEEKVAKGKG